MTAAKPTSDPAPEPTTPPVVSPAPVAAPTGSAGVAVVAASPPVVTTSAAAAAAAAAGETITCPECGEFAVILPGKRRAEDFCRRCDFPLFWARAAVITPSGEETGASLRRLPGTVGHADTASIDCPHCGEPNAPAAVLCIRCFKDLHPVAPPPPVVVVAPPPPPEPEPEPEPGFPWWWVLVICLCLLLITVIVAVVTLT